MLRPANKAVDGLAYQEIVGGARGTRLANASTRFALIPPVLADGDCRLARPCLKDPLFRQLFEQGRQSLRSQERVHCPHSRPATPQILDKAVSTLNGSRTTFRVEPPPSERSITTTRSAPTATLLALRARNPWGLSISGHLDGFECKAHLPDFIPNRQFPERRCRRRANVCR